MNYVDQVNYRDTDDKLIEAYLTVIDDLDSMNRYTENPISQQVDFDTKLYRPDEDLKKCVIEYTNWVREVQNPTIDKKRNKELKLVGGQLMEKIAYLSFRCLVGKGAIKSYQSSSGPQHDLVITGSSPHWKLLIALLRLKMDKVVLEAKNTDGVVTDAQFSRLCFIVENKFQNQCQLGIFFTRQGATGFPKTNDKRQRILKDAKATQIIFHAKTGKYIIVFDHEDIVKLILPGALPSLIRSKINDVEDVSGLSLKYDEDLNEMDDLPPHLAIYT